MRDIFCNNWIFLQFYNYNRLDAIALSLIFFPWNLYFVYFFRAAISRILLEPTKVCYSIKSTSMWVYMKLDQWEINTLQTFGQTRIEVGLLEQNTLLGSNKILQRAALKKFNAGLSKFDYKNVWTVIIYNQSSFRQGRAHFLHSFCKKNLCA